MATPEQTSKDRLLAALRRAEMALAHPQPPSRSGAHVTDETLSEIERRIDRALAQIRPFVRPSPPKETQSDG